MLLMFLAMSVQAAAPAAEAFERHASAAPSSGVLYAVIHRDGSGPSQRETSTLVAVRMDGTQEAIWNGGTIVTHDLAKQENLPLIRMGERVVSQSVMPGHEPATEYRPTALGDQTRPLAWPYLLALTAEDRTIIREQTLDDDNRGMRVSWSGTLYPEMQTRLLMSPDVPGQIIEVQQISPGQEPIRQQTTVPNGSPPWMAHLPLAEGESIEVFYIPNNIKLDADWLMQKEREHQLRMPANNIKSGMARPLWDDPRLPQAPGTATDAASEPPPPAATPPQRPGTRQPPPPERFDDAWRPTEGDAEGPLARQQSGFRRALLFTLGGTLVLIGAGIVVARKLKAS